MGDVGVIIIRVAEGQNDALAVNLSSQNRASLFLQKAEDTLCVAEQGAAWRGAFAAKQEKAFGFVAAISSAEVFLQLQEPLLRQFTINIPPPVLGEALPHLRPERR